MRSYLLLDPLSEVLSAQRLRVDLQQLNSSSQMPSDYPEEMTGCCKTVEDHIKAIKIRDITTDNSNHWDGQVEVSQH